jgi:putative transposase
MSERRACLLVAADRKMVRYRSRRPPDVELRTRLRDLANRRRRFGYRRLSILLREQGEPSGINRIYRIYREEGLTVRKRRARRRAIETSTPILVEAKVNARWSLDFVHDQLAHGRRFRILNIVAKSRVNVWRQLPTRRSRWHRVHLERHFDVGEGS